jgi:hypothetical protein
VEDIPKPIGTDFVWDPLLGRTEEAVEIRITGFPADSILQWSVNGTVHNIDSVSGPDDFTLIFETNSETELKAILETLTLTAPPQEDDNFNLTVTLLTTDDFVNNIGSYTHPVSVGAVADKPEVVSTVDIELEEDTPSDPLEVVVGRSDDADDSETLSVRFTIPVDPDDMLPVGNLTLNNEGLPDGYTFTGDETNGYLLTVPAGTPDQEVDYINDFFSNTTHMGLLFIPRPDWAGFFNGTEDKGIQVDLISTESASGVDLAPNTNAPLGTAFDEDTQIEIDTKFIGIRVRPANEEVVMASNVTFVNENKGETSGSAAVEIPIGDNMNLSISDDDPTQTAVLILSGFPSDVEDFVYATIAGVTVTESVDGNTTLTFSGVAANVFSTVQTLVIKLSDDSDQDFLIEIGGNLTDTNGFDTVTNDIGPLFHRVVVRATADEPTITIPTGLATIEENTASFANYPLDVTLADTDGSETIEQVIVEFSTEGSDGGTLPDVQFTTTGTGVATQSLTEPGQWTITGTDDEIKEALQSLRMKPGEDNGEDIIVSITAVAVESNPSDLGLNLPDDELFYVKRVNTTASFQVEVTPVIEDNSVSVGLPVAIANGTEDTEIDLGAVTVLIDTNLADVDSSELTYMDIRVGSYPVGSTIYINDNSVTNPGNIVTLVVDGQQYLRLPPNTDNSTVLSILPPLDYSGSFTLESKFLPSFCSLSFKSHDDPKNTHTHTHTTLQLFTLPQHYYYCSPRNDDRCNFGRRHCYFLVGTCRTCRERLASGRLCPSFIRLRPKYRAGGRSPWFRGASKGRDRHQRKLANHG